MAAILKVWRQIENPICQSKDIYEYFKSIPAKFHPDPISNDGALGFLKGSPPPQQQQQQEELEEQGE